MAVAGVKVSLNTDELKAFLKQIPTFYDKDAATKALHAAIGKAIKPFATYLKNVSPVGPTGNLKRAAGSKVVSYRRDGVAVGIVGYTRAGKTGQSAAGGTVRAGKDRAFHQWWIEQGTDDRKITTPKARVYMRKSPTKPFRRVRRGISEMVRGKGVSHLVAEQTPTYIASSYNKLGPFKIKQMRGGDAIETSPKYPRAFFKKSKTPIILKGIKPGGVAGRPPLNTAWQATQGEVAAILSAELSLSLDRAWQALQFRDRGTLSGTDTL